MEFLIWILILGGTAFFLWFGYQLLVQKVGVSPDDGLPVAMCSLCRRQFSLEELVAREKTAGFVSYFCGECIEELRKDHLRSVVSRRVRMN
jgi:hypothetical protein